MKKHQANIRQEGRNKKHSAIPTTTQTTNSLNLRHLRENTATDL